MLYVELKTYKVDRQTRRVDDKDIWLMRTIDEFGFWTQIDEQTTLVVKSLSWLKIVLTQ